jgi:hypothetical protein
MNLKMRIIISAVALLTTLNTLAAAVVLEKQDFSSAKISVVQDQSLILGNLSDSGVAKIRSNNPIGPEIGIHIAGVDRNLKLRDHIKGTEIQFGPFDQTTALSIVKEINGN